MGRIVLSVPGMTCRHCVRTVTAALRDVPGVETVTADARSTTVVLTGPVSVADALATLDACGFPGTAAPGTARG